MTESRVVNGDRLYIEAQNRLNSLALANKIDEDEFGFLNLVIRNLRNNDPNCKLSRMYVPYLEYFNLKKTVDELESVASSKDNAELYSNMRFRKLAIETASSVVQSITVDNLKEHNGMLYLATNDAGYKRIGPFDIDHLIAFVKACIDDRHAVKTYIMNDEIKKISSSAAFNIKSIDATRNYIIQFEDCYLLNAKIYRGTSPEFPRFFITRKVYDAVEAFEKDGTMPKPNEITGTAMDLALHIANYDRKTFERLIAASAMVFLNDLDKRAKYARFIRLYGPTGANGKSEYQKLMTRVVQEDNFTPFKVSDFDDQFKTGKIANALLAIEAEDEGKMSSNAAAQLKSMVTGDALTFREIRQSPEKARAISTIFSNSNLMLNTSDKSDGFARRLDWFKVNDRYERSHLGQIHFDNLRTEETAQFMTEYLLVTMLKVLKDNDLPEKSKQMIETDKEFTSNNDSAQDFVEEFGLHEIVGFSVAEIRKKYENWCELNARIELKHKFNTALESKFGLVRRKLGKSLINPESENYGLVESGSIKQISGWMLAGVKDSYDFNQFDDEGRVAVRLGVAVGSDPKNRTNLNELFGLGESDNDSVDADSDSETENEALDSSNSETEISNNDESENEENIIHQNDDLDEGKPSQDPPDDEILDNIEDQMSETNDVSETTDNTTEERLE